MKSVGLLKGAVILGGLAAGLLLSPACKAQSEISPDHFDGTDSWEMQARKVAPAKAQPILVAMQTSSNQAAGFRGSSLLLDKAGSAVLKAQKTKVADRRKTVRGEPTRQ